MAGAKRLLLASTTLLAGGLVLYALGVTIIGTVQAFNRPSADAQNVASSNKLLAEGKQVFPSTPSATRRSGAVSCGCTRPSGR
jgi:hypothetical protein